MKGLYVLRALLAVMVVGLVIIACNKDETVNVLDNQTQPRAELKQFSDFLFLGEMHNDYLSYANDVYPGSGVHDLPKEERNIRKLELLRDFEPTPNQYGIYTDIFDHMFDDDETNALIASRFRDNPWEDEALMTELFDIIDQLIAKGHSNASEKHVLQAFVDLVQSVPTETEYEQGIEDLISYWNAQQYPKSEFTGDLSACTLVIASYSLDWWTTNTNGVANIHGDIHKFWGAVLAYVAKDVMMGLLTILVDEIGEAIREGDQMVRTGEEVAWAFGSGAVMGSIF